MNRKRRLKAAAGRPGDVSGRLASGRPASASIRYVGRGVWLVVCAACFALASGCQQGGDEDAAANVQTFEIERGPVKVVLEISPKTVRLSDEPRVVLTVDAAEGIDVDKPEFGLGMDAWQILDFREPLPTTSNGRRVFQQIYSLEPLDAGMQPIDPIAISFRDENGKSHVIETEAIEIEVTTMLDGEAPSLSDLQPARPPVALIVEPFPWLKWGLGILLVAGSVYGVRRWLKRVRPEREIIIPPHEIAKQELAELRARKLEETDVKEFYVELTGIVRRYVESTTGVSAPEQTTDEFLRAISHHPEFTRTERERFESFLESADLVKYAAWLPSADDIAAGFDRASDFVSARPEATAAEAIIPAAQELSA